MTKQLGSKVALVTGGGSGIGRAVALCLAREGANIALVDRDIASAQTVCSLCHEFGVQAQAYEADVADFAVAQTVVDDVVASFGALDILVNNAGINQDAVIWKMTEEQWDKVIAVDLKGVFNYTRAAATVFKAAKSGKIINVASINGLRGKFGQANYSAAKAGVIGFTKTVALELGRSNVNVNCVCPGLISTDMVMAMPEAAIAKSVEEIAIGRMGASEDVAEVIAFLASEKARHITGEVIKVDGGQYI